MTASANQLIAKALSTTSEDEAIACLRMARKRGARMVGDTSTKASSHSQSDIERLKNSCRAWESLYHMADRGRQDWETLYFKNKKKLAAVEFQRNIMILLVIMTWSLIAILPLFFG